MTFPALQNILMDSIKTVAESTWNGHPPLSMQASGVWGGSERNRAAWSDVI